MRFGEGLLRRLAAVEASTFLPGHGPRVDRAFVEVQAAAFEGVAAARATSASEPEALAAAPDQARVVLGGELEAAVRGDFAMVEAPV